MTIATFDRLAYFEKLREAGVDEKIARAQTDALDVALRETVATRADVELAKSETKVAISELKAVVEANKSDILRWTLTSQLAIAGLLFAALTPRVS